MVFPLPLHSIARLTVSLLSLQGKWFKMSPEGENISLGGSTLSSVFSNPLDCTREIPLSRNVDAAEFGGIPYSIRNIAFAELASASC